MIELLEQETTLVYSPKEITHVQKLLQWPEQDKELYLLISAGRERQNHKRKNSRGTYSVSQQIYGVVHSLPDEYDSVVKLPTILLSKTNFEAFVASKLLLNENGKRDIPLYPSDKTLYNSKLRTGKEVIQQPTHAQKLKAPNDKQRPTEPGRARHIWLIMAAESVDKAQVRDVVEAVYLPEQYQELVYLPVLPVNLAVYQSWLIWKEQNVK